MFDYEEYYNEPSEVEILFNEFSEKLKTMLKNEIVENAKKHNVDKDQVKTMMMIANGLKEEYEKKLENFEVEINKKSMEYHNLWLEKLLKTDIKVGDTVYKVFQSGSTELKCPYCENGQIQIKLKDKFEWVQCPICKGWKPRLPKYDYKKVKVAELQITLITNKKDQKVSPYVDNWSDIPNYAFDKVRCNWNIKDENWDNLTSDRVGKTEEDAKKIIEKLIKNEKDKLAEKYGKENLDLMLKDIGESK